MESPNLTSILRFTLSVVLLCLPLSFLYAQTPYTEAGDANQSWTASTESQAANTNPTRTTESHKQSGNRTVESQNVERLGPNGHYELYFDTEKESVQVTPTTTRTVERTFSRDGSGRKILTQVTEEERESLPGGNEKSVRVTSNSDLEGRLQVVRREIAETKKTSPDVEETKTTVFLSNGSGGMVPSMQIQERQKTSSDHTVNLQKSTLLLDGAGNWQVNELKESTIKENGKERTTDERISRPGSDGKLGVVSSSLSKESETASGEKRNTVETYSTDIPGSTPDGKLHLSQRVTTLNRSRPDGGKQTEQQIEQPNPGDPNAGLGVTIKTVDLAQPGPSGIRETHTIQVPDSTGSFGVVSVDNTKSDKRQPVTVDISPPDKPK
jgi:hypothetical protein